MNRRLLLVPPLLIAAAAACDDEYRPGGRLRSETTELTRYGSCVALERDLKSALIHEAWANIDMRDDLVFDSPSADSGRGETAGGRQEGVDYSGTNNQESGVDEADFVKTDGYHIYNVNGNRLHIFAVPQFGQLQPVSVTQIEGHPREMLLHKEANRAVVFSWIDSRQLPATHPLRAKVERFDSRGRPIWRINQVGKVTVLDITNRAAPRAEREFYFEGWYQTARRIETSIRMASFASFDRSEVWDWYEDLERYGADGAKDRVAARINALRLADLVPEIYVRRAGGELVSNTLTEGSCRSFMRPYDSHGRGIASILTFDLANPELRWDADHVVSNHGTFYASTDTLVLAEKAHDWWWYWWWQDDADQLNVHTFDISQPGATRYTGSGRVRGHLSDQFAIDEEDGAIRLATTTDLWGRWWRRGNERRESENHVWVLEKQGNQVPTVGHIGGIAKGERITAARFLGDKGYLVTFRQVDPLFTLDLSDRTNPRLVGELKIPGFSTYLHPVNDGTLLSIGVGGDENGANWRATVSLFDVSNFAQPMLKTAMPIAGDSGWSWSEALWEHKAFTYFAPKKMLAVPQSNYARVSGNEWRYLSKLELVGVDPVAGLAPRGSIDHTGYYQADRYRYWSRVDIRRSIFMGDFIYAISDKAISVHRLSDAGLVADELLPGYQYSDWWWGGW